MKNEQNISCTPFIQLMLIMCVENIEKKINLAIASSNSSMMYHLSLEFEECLLEENSFPDKHFNLLLRLLMDDKFCSISGSEHFIRGLYTDFEKLQYQQRNVLLDTLISNAVHYKNKIFIHSVADIIARKYPIAIALKTFQNALKDGGEEGRYAALVGAEILIKNKRIKDTEKQAVFKLISAGRAEQ